MNITNGFYISITILLIMLGISIVYYGISRKHYLMHRTLLRKIYYFTVLAVTLFLVYQNIFPFLTSVGIIGFTIAIIVIDLMIIQTPDITKFMSHELKQEEYTDQIEKNEGNVQLLTDKIIKFHDMMPKPSSPWIMEDEFDFSPNGYENSMKQYLRDYTEKFNINLFSYHVNSSDDKDVFKENLKKQYLLIMKHQHLSTRAVGMRNKDAIEKLLSGNNAKEIEIFHDGQTIVIFPYFGEYYNFIMVITSRNGVPVGGVDAALLLSLMYTFDSWLGANYELDVEEDISEEV